MVGLVVPWVYCRCDAAAGEVCPGCGTRVPLADAGGVPLPPLLAGCRRASSSARAAATAVDAVMAVGFLGLGVLGARSSTSLAVLVVVVAAVATPAVLISYLQDGRTPGRLLTGLRTVDVFTGVPLRRRAALWQRRAGSVLLDVRNGRDPVRPVAETGLVPLPPTPGPAAGSQASAQDATERPHVVMRRSARVSRLSDLVLDDGGAQTERLPTPFDGPRRSPATAPEPSTAVMAIGSVLTGGDSGAVDDPSVRVTLDDGIEFDLRGAALVGRCPVPAEGEEVDVLVQVRDAARSVSETHLGLWWDGELAWVEDRHSANGTTVIDPAGTWRALEPGRLYPVASGSYVELGDRRLLVGAQADGRPTDGADAR